MQKVGDEQSTATSRPAARRPPRCHDVPSNSKSRPDRSTATQKVVVGQDTELSAPAGAMCRPLVHVTASKRKAFAVRRVEESSLLPGRAVRSGGGRRSDSRVTVHSKQEQTGNGGTKRKPTR